MSSKGSERIAAFPVGYWAPASKFQRFTGVAILALSDGGDTVTAQLRKATDGNGTGATNFGTAVIATQPGTSPAANDLLRAAADGNSDGLGRDGSGVQYTHVSLSIAGGSPEVEQGMLLAFDARYFDDTLAGVNGQVVQHI